MRSFTLPRLIFEGEESLERFVDHLKENGFKKILIVTDKNLVRLGLVNILTSALEGFNVYIYDDVQAEPSFENVEEGGKYAINVAPEVIIALGGGSVIDAAKGIWIKYEDPEFDLRSISPLFRIGLGNKALFVSIPTTSGTGSDASLGVVYTNIEEGVREKVALGSFELVSNIIVLDPIFVKNLPLNLTIYTGLDALSHVVEALVSTSSNDFTDALSLKCIVNIFKYLPKLVREPGNTRLRRKLHFTATLAGMAFSNSGLGLAHAVGHALGGVLHLHHGRSVSLILPYVVKFNYEDDESRSKYEEVRYQLAKNNVAEDSLFYSQIIGLLKNLGVEVSLNNTISYEEFKSKLDLIIEGALQDPNIIYNPITPSYEDINQILEMMYKGKFL